MAAHSEPLAPKKRLDSWKEIAAFFGRDERTVKRWEKERGLPVYRVPGSARGGVFAYAEELAECIRADGLTLRTPSGAKAHPLLKEELSARSFVARTISRLGLNFEPLRSGPGRPAGR